MIFIIYSNDNQLQGPHSANSMHYTVYVHAPLCFIRGIKIFSPPSSVTPFSNPLKIIFLFLWEHCSAVFIPAAASAPTF